MQNSKDTLLDGPFDMKPSSSEVRRVMLGKDRRHLYLFVVTVLALAAPVAEAQSQPNALPRSNMERYVSQTHARIVFDKNAFSSGPVPYWSRGYLIATRVESDSATTANVTLFGEAGSKSADVVFWFPESVRVAVTSAALTKSGDIIASGEADKADGTRAPFIALANREGQIAKVIQTSNFYPRNICAAPDGSVWAFGSMMWNDAKRQPIEGNLLRRFDFQRGELASYLPQATFPSQLAMEPDALSFIRCSEDAVFVYSTPASMFITLSYKSSTPSSYAVSALSGLHVGSLAVTSSDAVFGTLVDRKGDSGKNGLYYLVTDDASHSARWQPVSGAVGHFTDGGVVSRVLGADGEDLVVSRVGDPAERTALHWISTSIR